MASMSRRARSASLTRYRMVAAERVQSFTSGPRTTLLYVFDALPDAFKCIGLRGDVEQALIGFGILDDRFRLSIDGKNQRFLRFLEQLHELPRIAAERRHRLNVFFDVKHDDCDDSTLKGAIKPRWRNLCCRQEHLPGAISAPERRSTPRKFWMWRKASSGS